MLDQNDHFYSTLADLREPKGSHHGGRLLGVDGIIHATTRGHRLDFGVEIFVDLMTAAGRRAGSRCRVSGRSAAAPPRAARLVARTGSTVCHSQAAGFDALQIVIGLARDGRKAILGKRSTIALTHRGKRAMINAGSGCRSAVARSRGFEGRWNCARS